RRTGGWRRSAISCDATSACSARGKLAMRVRGEALDFITYIRENRERFTELLIQHLELTVYSVLLAVLIAVPLAILASRVELLAKPLTWLGAIGQTIPSLAI